MASPAFRAKHRILPEAPMTAIAPPVAAARPARARPDRRRQGWVRRAPLLPALVFTIIVTQLPFVLTLWYSLQSWSLVRPGSQHFVGFANYVDVFQDSQFRTTALNTVIMTVGVVLIAMVIGVALALLLDRKFLGRGIVRTLLITPFLVMPVAGAPGVEDGHARSHVRHRQLPAPAVRHRPFQLDRQLPARAR